MSAFLSIRNDVHFRRFFDRVHPFFWPVLYWQLKRAWLALQREKLTCLLLAVSWWGGVTIAYRGDRIEAPKADPFALVRPRFDDPYWFTSVPACLGPNKPRGTLLHIAEGDPSQRAAAVCLDLDPDSS